MHPNPENWVATDSQSQFCEKRASLEYILGVSWSPTLKDIAEPSRGRVFLVIWWGEQLAASVYTGWEMPNSLSQLKFVRKHHIKYKILYVICIILWWSIPRCMENCEKRPYSLIFCYIFCLSFLGARYISILSLTKFWLKIELYIQSLHTGYRAGFFLVYITQFLCQLHFNLYQWFC